LVRDVRLAYAEREAAAARERTAARRVELRTRSASLGESRLRSGDAAESELAMLRADLLQAELERSQAARASRTAAARLDSLLGLFPDGTPPDYRTSGPPEPAAPWDERALLELAVRVRPDLQAARLGMSGAAERADLSDLELFTVTAVLDANQPKGPDGLELGPGLDIAIPIFNQNQGARARAAAEVSLAARRYASTKHRIVLEVRTALQAWTAAQEARDLLSAGLLPLLDEAHRSTQRAYDEGATSLAPVLDAEARRLDAGLTLERANADLRRARAELARSV
jgi:cobalt-zinc-cadmium efflux system outer membrane protein